jgi:hypothetical protein
MLMLCLRSPSIDRTRGRRMPMGQPPSQDRALRAPATDGPALAIVTTDRTAQADSVLLHHRGWRREKYAAGVPLLGAPRMKKAGLRTVNLNVPRWASAAPL